MTGSAGASFSDTRATTFGIEIGERINSRVQAYAAFNYFDDLFNNQAASDLSALSSYLTTVTGTPWQLQGRDRGLAFSGGARYLLSRGPSFRPYVGGGPGVLNLRRTITDARLGNVTDPVLVVFGAPDGFIVPDKESSFRATAEFIAGVGIAAGRTYLDVGYRVRKVFRVEAYMRPFHLAGSLEYVASGAYRNEPSFQRFLQNEAERQRARGEPVDLWK